MSQLERAVVGPRFEHDGGGVDHHGLRRLRVLGLADGAVGVHGTGAFRLHPPLQALQVHVLHSPSALAQVQQRIALAAWVVANIALWSARIRVGVIVVHIRLRLLDVVVWNCSLLQQLCMRLGIILEADLGNKHVSLAQTEDVALLQPPRNEPCPPHAQLEEDVSARAREAGRAADGPVLVDHRAEPEVVVLTIVANKSTPPRELSEAKEGAHGEDTCAPPGFKRRKSQRDKQHQMRWACTFQSLSKIEVELPWLLNGSALSSASRPSLLRASALSVAPDSSTV